MDEEKQRGAETKKTEVDPESPVSLAPTNPCESSHLILPPDPPTTSIAAEHASLIPLLKHLKSPKFSSHHFNSLSKPQ